MQSVPYFDYSRAFEPYNQQILDITKDILGRGAFIQQRDLVEFEQHLAKFLNVKHAFGVANCTDGLVMLARAAGIKPGDEVIFPSHTMVASAAAMVHAGASPVPVDCGPDHLIDPVSVEAAITARTRAIIPVHLNGRTCDMAPLQAIAESHNLLIIEDAAQALGSTYRGKHAGTFGIGAAISFYPAKILGCLGDGGAVVTDDDKIAQRVYQLRDHGRNEQGEVVEWGYNSRLDNLQAAILDLQFKDYDKIIHRRRELASLYDSRLRDLKTVCLPPAPGNEPDRFDVYQNYEIEADRRDGLRGYLKERGIGTLLPWGGKAVHQFAGLGISRDLPATARLFQRCLMLPINMMISNDDVEYVCRAIREFYCG